jgi:hypothetical protein
VLKSLVLGAVLGGITAFLWSFDYTLTWLFAGLVIVRVAKPETTSASS